MKEKKAVFSKRRERMLARKSRNDENSRVLVLVDFLSEDPGCGHSLHSPDAFTSQGAFCSWCQETDYWCLLHLLNRVQLSLGSSTMWQGSLVLFLHYAKYTYQNYLLVICSYLSL